MNKCETCRCNKVCDHYKLGFENYDNYISEEVRCSQCKHLKIINKELSELEKDILYELALCNMNTSAVARKMMYHRNTVIYHINKVYERLGKDPLNFFDLCELLRGAGYEI